MEEEDLLITDTTMASDTNITQLNMGMNTDLSPQNQPEGSYRFALNAVDESELGDSQLLSNEESNITSVYLPGNFIPIGKKYIGNGDTALFLVSKDESVSEIGIFNEKDKYTTYVNDSTSTEKLNFKLTNQIDCTYRLRKGCERTIYFTDGINPPRYFNFDKVYNFKDSNDKFVANLFNLFHSYESIATIDLSVSESGNLPSGSYNVAFQYVDFDLNPTEWMSVTDTVNIYNDSMTKPYSKVRGSTNLKNSYQDFGNTNKAINVVVGNLDENYPYYRLAFISATDGSGNITKIFTTEEIPLKQVNYTFDGNNITSTTTVEDIKAFQNIIDRASHIEQVENRLILANVKNKDVPWYKLQKYASKIDAELVTKEIRLDKISEGNTKNPNVHNQSVGYMPGEIYSFGIVYVFKDGSTSPVFHIPGRSPLDTRGTSIGLKNTENECSSVTYNSLSEKCKEGDYWGVDYLGNPLKDQPVRHHRFPLRSEVSKPLVNRSGEIIQPEGQSYNFYITLSIASDAEEQTVEVSYGYTHTINPTHVIHVSEVVSINITSSMRGNTIEFLLGNNTSEPDTGVATYLVGSPIGITQVSSRYSAVLPISNISETITTEIFGINFKYIDLPSLEDTNGNEIVGYYIVRNERLEEDKTILDSGVLTPSTKDPDNKFVAHGMLCPRYTIPGDAIKTDMFGLINPEFKFNGREYKNFDVIQQGEYYRGNFTNASSANDVPKRILIDDTVQDVYPGTSYDPDKASKREKDSDGFDLHVVARNTPFEFTQVSGTLLQQSQINEVFYLNAVSYKTVVDSQNKTLEMFNISSDNKVGNIISNVELPVSKFTNKLPYVVLKQNKTDFYTNFRLRPYVQASKFQSFQSSYPGENVHNIKSFSGDSYVTSMKYTNSLYYDIRFRQRAAKKGAWKIILGAALVVAGVVGAIFTGGASLTLAAVGVGLLGAGAGISLIASGIEQENLAKVYRDKYEQGLRYCAKDLDTELFFADAINPPDDEVQWFLDTISNVWVESSVNTSLRQGNTLGLTDFMNDNLLNFSYDPRWTVFDAISNEAADMTSYAIEKLTVLDADYNDGRLYRGYANAEYYEVNKDFQRRRREKLFFALDASYDCCSKCFDEFPHRVIYSEQSFQEELTDNYRMFLPNNYRDIDGETGKITNIFKIQNSLFIHTEEAIWNLPKNYQERVTNQIVSFLGTGDFFSIAPQKMVDDDSGNSAGTVHKWGAIKTQHGYFFPCQGQNCFYMFDGKSLKPISDNGIKNTLYYKMFFDIEKQLNIGKYWYNDNPSNPIGIGYVSTYDSKKERIIFTKKDFMIDPSIIGDYGSDIRLTMYNGGIYFFVSFNSTIAAKEAEGYTYKGIINDQMVFSKIVDDEVVYSNVSGEQNDQIITFNNSWTISYSLKSQSFTSWHSYLPEFYIHTSQNFFSWKYNLYGNRIWRHGVFGEYQKFYGTGKPFIIDYVSKSKTLENKIWEYIKLYLQTKKYSLDYQDFSVNDDIFFSKCIFYNERQSSGLMLIKQKNSATSDYMTNPNNIGTNDNVYAIADKNENIWSINNMRSIVSDKTKPLFTSSREVISDDYFIDKIPNNNALNAALDWTEVENFRGNYLQVRLISDNFTPDMYATKLIFKYSVEDENLSIR